MDYRDENTKEMALQELDELLGAIVEKCQWCGEENCPIRVVIRKYEDYEEG